MSTISINIPSFTRAPRGALWAADLFSGLLSAFATPPAAVVTPQSRRAAEAEAVRTMACELQATDRDFADDLYAAADRHERMAG